MRSTIAALATTILCSFSLTPASAQERSEEEIAAVRNAVFNDPETPVMGNPRGKTVLVEFSDYNCGFCRKTMPEVAALLKSDPKLKLVIHEIPIFGEGSRYAATAALAAQMQGKYPEFHQALMSMKGKAEEASVMRRSQDYFKHNEKFDIVEYEERVFKDGKVIEAFQDYKSEYESTKATSLDDRFDISDYAVKKHARVFKSIIKLDKNFHIYVHGDKNKILKGTDDDGKKYYILYYEEES